jgi:hypothetical protein
MFGFVFGTVCLIGLIKLAWCGRRAMACSYGGYGYGEEWGGSCHGGRWGRGPWARHGHGHGPWHHGHGHGPGPRGWRGRGFGERAALRFLFERLDTTPGQEKVIIEAYEEIKDPLKQGREGFGAIFGDLAKAMRAGEFDHTAVAETWMKQDKSLEQARIAIAAALARVHDALDERQRKILAELLESGPGFGFGHRFGRDEDEGEEV